MTFLIVTEFGGDDRGASRRERAETLNAESLSAAICAVTDHIGSSRGYSILQREDRAVISVAPCAGFSRERILIQGSG